MIGLPVGFPYFELLTFPIFLYKFLFLVHGGIVKSEGKRVKEE